MKKDSEEGELVYKIFRESIDNARLQAIMRVQDFLKWNSFEEFKSKSFFEETNLFVATVG